MLQTTVEIRKNKESKKDRGLSLFTDEAQQSRRMGTVPGQAIETSEGMIKFAATRFGELSVAKDKIITFSNGILGFPDAKRFIILDYEGEVPFKWLQSVDDPALAFLVVFPNLIKPDYTLSLKESDIADLGECEDGNIALFIILTIPGGDPKGMTANLRGPLVINSVTMKGKQIVLQDDRYQIKHPVFSY